MKYIFIIFLILLQVSMYMINIYANYNVNQVSYEKNTQLNIKWAKLIKKYLYSLLNNLNELKNKYKVSNNKNIEKYSKTLNSMIILLSKIDNTNISKQKAEEVMRIIIQELKPLNKNIKILLKKEKLKQNKKIDTIKQKYYDLSLKLSRTLDKIIIKYYITIKGKSKLTLNEKKLLKNLRNLKINSDSLKKIKNLNLDTIDNIKQELLKILKNIKKELIILKSII